MFNARWAHGPGWARAAARPPSTSRIWANASALPGLFVRGRWWWIVPKMAKSPCDTRRFSDRRGPCCLGMTKLPGRGFSRSPEQTSGLAERACFWDLTRRHIELRRMSKDALRHAAHGIDARLQADKMQTMCHGDPKGANIMYDEEEGISFYDFQWFGKAPASKEAKSICPPAFEYLWDSYHLALCDLGRWMVGGFSFGNTRLIFRHVKELTTALAGLDSEAKCQERWVQNQVAPVGGLPPAMAGPSSSPYHSEMRRC
eukprot:Skav203306  [mRNA]  locus=scaffold2587:58636:65433:- [translate_table: standard]